jgi:RNA polymerase sigma-70 factor (TIGR02960 family)
MPLADEEFTAQAERHRRELHVHCYRMLGSFEEAEDLVQETMMRAWRSRDALDADARLRPWLYKIATNACVDAIRSRGRRVPSLASFRDVPWLQPYPDRLLDEVAEPGEGPEADLVARETIELTFLAVIQLLPPRQRAVLILREVLEWPAKDVADVLEIGVAAVNSALQRARATLREHLPTRRRDDWRAPEVTDEERRLLERYMRAHGSGDTATSLALIADDIRVTMPPNPYLFEGREQIADLMAQAGPMGEWRLVPTSANRLPAAASYLRAPGDTILRAFKLDVLRIERGAIAEITTFDASLFEAFGLPQQLDG